MPAQDVLVIGLGYVGLPLAIAAEHSRTITLGTAIAVAFARNPMSLAYTAHDLQVMSRGRFVLGLFGISLPAEHGGSDLGAVLCHRLQHGDRLERLMDLFEALGSRHGPAEGDHRVPLAVCGCESRCEIAYAGA